MAEVVVTAGGTSNINTSSTDDVSFLGLGTLNIAGVPGSPINVILSQVGGVGVLDTINITDANVALGGVAGVSALVAYNIGSGGTLDLASTVGVTAGTAIIFTGPNSHLVLGNAINVSLLSGIFGFGPGSTIDVSPLATGLSYADAPGNNTGGVITLTDSNGNVVGVLPLASGEFNTGSFRIAPDGLGGTVIGIATTVTSLAAAPATGDLGAGQAVALTLTTSDPVTVSGGTPTLALNDGGIATYNAAASTPTSLAFTYTVAAGENTPDLTVAGIAANGASVANAGGTAVDLTGATGNPAGILQIDTTQPSVTSLTAAPGAAALGAGQIVTFTVGTNEAVTVASGTPTLTLNDGGTATYNSAASTPTSLVFITTVAPGQNTPDLAVIAANLNGATVTDGAGNVADLSGAVANPAGVLQIDTTAPTVVSVATQPGSGAIPAGQTVTLTLGTSEAVAVTGGTPTLTLNDGGTATYNPTASTPTSLVFTTTVVPGQNTPDLTITAVNLNGATVADPAGNAANLTGAVTNPPGVLTIDTTAPSVTGVSTTPASGSLGAGQTVTVAVAVTEPVTVTGGTPTLTLTDGGMATYNPTMSTPTSLAFTTTVAPGQNTPDLTITGVNLNGATVADPAGNAANLTGAVTNPPGVLAIDTTAPSVAGVSTTPASGSLGAGQTVTITVGTTEPVTVAGGTPTLTLSDGGTATYNPTASTPTSLVFTTTVAPGQNTPDLTITAVNLNGAAIADPAGNAANLAGAVTNPPGVLAIDTTAPSVTGVSTTPASGTVVTGQTVTVAVGTTEPVTVAGSTPTLTLSNGGTATYNPTASTPTGLVFTTTVASGQDTPDLTVTGVNLNGATVADAAGNAANLSGAVTNPPGILQVDTVAHPFLNLVASNSDPGIVVTVSAALISGGQGTYGNLGSGKIGADGKTYTVSGSAAQVTAALAAVTLVPTNGSAATGALAATVSDGNPQASTALADTGALANQFVVLTPGDVAIAGAGSNVLLAAAAADTLVGGSGQNSLAGSAAGSFLAGTTGATTFFGRADGTAGRDIILAGSGAATIFGGTGGSLIGLGSGSAVVSSRGTDTIFGGAGPAVIGTSSNALVALGSGSDTVFVGQGSTVIGGAGAETVDVLTGGALLFAGPGRTLFLGGSGSSTVIGGTGANQLMLASTGGGLFGSGSGGGNTVVGGQQATTIFGGGSGDMLFAAGPAGTVIVAGTGNQTLSGALSSGNDIFFAGSGNNVIGLGSGQDVVAAGSGNATVFAGTGQDLLAIVNGRAGGTETLVGFKIGTDHVSLQGYAAGEIGRAVASATTVAGNASAPASTTVTLSDNTRVTFLGVSSITSGAFV